MMVFLLMVMVKQRTIFVLMTVFVMWTANAQVNGAPAVEVKHNIICACKS